MPRIELGKCGILNSSFSYSVSTYSSKKRLGFTCSLDIQASEIPGLGVPDTCARIDKVGMHVNLFWETVCVRLPFPGVAERFSALQATESFDGSMMTPPVLISYPALLPVYPNYTSNASIPSLSSNLLNPQHHHVKVNISVFHRSRLSAPPHSLKPVLVAPFASTLLVHTFATVHTSALCISMLLMSPRVAHQARPPPCFLRRVFSQFRLITHLLM